MTSKREQQKTQTRERILEAAYAVYSEHGFQATTAQIAQAAGVSHGSIFAHFPTLDDLLQCLIERFGRALAEQTHAASHNQGGLSGFCHWHLRLLAEHEAFYTHLISQSSLLPDTCRISLISLQSAVAHHLEGPVREAQAAGQIKSVPLHLLFNTWLGLLHYYLQNRALFAVGTGSVLLKHEEELVEYFLTLIASSEGLRSQ